MEGCEWEVEGGLTWEVVEVGRKGAAGEQPLQRSSAAELELDRRMEQLVGQWQARHMQGNWEDSQARGWEGSFGCW